MTSTPHRAPTAHGPLRALVERRREEIKTVAARHRVHRVRVFGSVARGEERPDSDIDFLVDFRPGASLFDLVDLIDELRELLDHPVDVVSRGGLKPRDQRILDEAIDL